MEDGYRRRLLTKVARLYHHSGLRQVEIADRLRISQTRVSRLLRQAEADGIVHTVVVPLIGLNATVEEQLEARYSLAEAHVVDTVADSEDELGAELGEWYAQENPPTATSITVRLQPEHWRTYDFAKLFT